jgi:ZIP family zinc transporter
MLQALIFGIISGLSLVIGSATGIFFNLKKKTIASFMAFGSGVLICALTFGLMEEAFKHGGFDAIIIGFLLGGLVFIGGDYLINLYGGRRQKHSIVKKNSKSNGLAITLGTILDGIPESIALGISIFNGQALGILMLAAIVLSNFPEGISSVTGLKKEGYNKWQIVGTWIVVAILVAITVVLSYVFLRNVDPNTIGIIEAFAAGAILAMLADSMMPEAYEEGGFGVAIMTILGFLTAFIISRF